MRRWWRLQVQGRVYWRLARHARRVHGRGPLLVAIGDSHTDPRCAYTLPRQVWLRIVGREGYTTVNLGHSGDATGDMRRRIDQVLSRGQPEIVVVFGGANDARLGIDPAETERDVTFMTDWLRDHGIGKIVLIGPPLVNFQPAPDWFPATEEIRSVLRDVADRHGAVWVDLAAFLRGRIERGQDPDFSRVRYTQSRSWHVEAGDPHLNAYGQRLVAEAFLTATADWRSSRRRRHLWPLRRGRIVTTPWPRGRARRAPAVDDLHFLPDIGGFCRSAVTNPASPASTGSPAIISDAASWASRTAAGESGLRRAGH